MSFHEELLETFNGLFLLLRGREHRILLQQRPQRMHDTRVRRTSMRLDVIHRTKERLQVLQILDRRPFLNRLNQVGVRPPAFSPYQFPN